MTVNISTIQALETTQNNALWLIIGGVKIIPTLLLQLAFYQSFQKFIL